MDASNFFTKDINRQINGVITADDEVSLKLELEEYVLTKEAEEKLSDFLESYNSGAVNGAWISGHFGSGKSHLLKMIAAVLENRIVDGQPASDIFLPKCKHNTMLYAALQKAVSIPSRSILFNIAQMSPSDKVKGDAVLEVFVKVFNKSCGYNYQYPGIPNFERELDHDGKLELFKEKFAEKVGKSWDEYGARHALIQSKKIDEVYNEIYGSDVKDIIKEKKDSGKISVEDFGVLVQEQIKRDGRPGFRINFFVDEVGQFVANNTQLMLSLQTIAETLNTKCRGQCWITVTSQVDLSNIVGTMNRTDGNDFSRIEARFAVKMLLSGQNANEVIQKRLVEKTPSAIAALSPVWRAHASDFKTLYDFVDGSKKYATFENENEFVNFYPFPIYQFALFHTAMAALSSNEAFTGKYTSVGERSMLTVCQKAVTKLMKGDFNPGKIVPFDYWFEGIRNSIQPIQINQISVAEVHLNIPMKELAIRILKALYLVKYVREFKSTIRNLCVLLLDDLNVNMQEFRKQIETCLTSLENESYVQHVGELYEYLTDEEKSIDKEIRDVECSTANILDLYAKYAFGFTTNKKIGDRSFDARLDDQVQGRQSNVLSINVITHLNPINGNRAELVSKTLGTDELVVEMPQDSGLVRDMMNYVRTLKYLRNNSPASEPEGPRKRLLEARSTSNGMLEDRIQNAFKNVLGNATIYFSGEELKPQSTDGRTNIEKAFNRLVERTFSQYSLIGVFADKTENDVPRFLKTETSLPGFQSGQPTPAENAVFAFVQQTTLRGQRVTMESVVRNFESKPYGWRIGSIDCVVARLFASGRLEFTIGANTLDERALAGVLCNTRRQGELILTPVQSASPQEMRLLSDFASEFFNQPFTQQTTKELLAEVRACFERLANEVDQMLMSANEFPFLEKLRDFSNDLHTVIYVGKDNSYFFNTDFQGQQEQLFASRDRVFAPIKKMMSGDGRTVYLRARNFLIENSANLECLQLPDAACLKKVLESPDAYTNQIIMQIRAYSDALEKTLNDSIILNRNNALASFEQHVGVVHASPEYAQASDDIRRQADEQIDAVRESITAQKVISVFNQKVADFKNILYPAIITRLANTTSGDPTASAGKTTSVHALSDAVRGDISKVMLASAEDVDVYLQNLRTRIESEIANGAKILL